MSNERVRHLTRSGREVEERVRRGAQPAVGEVRGGALAGAVRSRLAARPREDVDGPLALHLRDQPCAHRARAGQGRARLGARAATARDAELPAAPRRRWTGSARRARWDSECAGGRRRTRAGRVAAAATTTATILSATATAFLHATTAIWLRSWSLSRTYGCDGTL